MSAGRAAGRAAGLCPRSALPRERPGQDGSIEHLGRPSPVGRKPHGQADIAAAHRCDRPRSHGCLRTPNFGGAPMRVAGRLRHLNVSEPPISGGAPMRCVGRLGHLDVSEPQFRGRADAVCRPSRSPGCFRTPISGARRCKQPTPPTTNRAGQTLACRFLRSRQGFCQRFSVVWAPHRLFRPLACGRPGSGTHCAHRLPWRNSTGPELPAPSASPGNTPNIADDGRHLICLPNGFVAFGSSARQATAGQAAWRRRPLEPI